jgi:hypothetical protein
LNCGSTVERNKLLTKVKEVACIGSSCELRSVNTGFEELFFDAGSTFLTKSVVDLIVTGVVIGPACYDIFVVGLRLHNFSDSVDDANILRGQLRDVDGVVDSSQGSFGGLSSHFFRAIEAIFELLLKVGDASVSSLEACTKGVAVFGFGANGNNGSTPVAFGEEVSYAQESGSVISCFVPTIFGFVEVVVSSGEAQIKRDLHLFANLECVDKTGANGEDFIFGVLIRA